MPHVDNEFVGYVDGEFLFRNSEGELTPYESTFVPDWRVDNDPRLVADYVGCLSERYLDRRNDVYELDVTTSNSGSRRNEAKEYAGHYGYDVVPAAGHVVRCWYCNHDFSYREFAGTTVSDAGKQAFVTAMLVHYYEHRSNGDLPYVTTYFPGRQIVNPTGKVVATKPGVVRTWRINGKLLSV